MKFRTIFAVFGVLVLAGCHTGTVSVLEGNRIMADKIPQEAATAGNFCEGTYNCTTSGSTFTVGEQTTIGFWGRATCPGSTSLSDGSGWTYVPLTCRCP